MKSAAEDKLAKLAVLRKTVPKQVEEGYTKQMQALRPRAKTVGPADEDQSAEARNLSADVEKLSDALEDTKQGFETVKSSLEKQLTGLKQTQQVVSQKSFTEAVKRAASETAAAGGDGGSGPMRERVAASCHRHTPY